MARVAAAVRPGRRSTVLGTSGPAAASTPADEDALLSWADALRTPAMRLDVLVLLCLGLGAGLTTAETTAALGPDVVQHDGAVVTATVAGQRARLVPVRARYGPLLLDLAEQAGTGPLFRPDAEGRGGRNGVSNLVARARSGCDPRLPVLSPQRMRATWLVRHLDAGVRADALLKAAGLDSLAVLGRYLPSVRPLTTAQVLAELAGASS